MTKIHYDLVDLVMIKFFKKAPAHIYIPQREELKNLNLEQLETLLTLDSIDELQTKCKDIIPNEFVKRLLRKTKINQAIKNALDEGRYELAEDQTSSVDI